MCDVDNSHCIICNKKMKFSKAVDINHRISSSNQDYTFYQFLQTISNFNQVDIANVPQNSCKKCFQIAEQMLDFQILCNKSAEKLISHVEHIVKEEVVINFENESDHENSEEYCVYLDDKSDVKVQKGDERMDSVREENEESDEDDADGNRSKLQLKEEYIDTGEAKEMSNDESLSEEEEETEYFEKETKDLDNPTPEEIRKREERERRNKYQTEKVRCNVCNKIYSRGYMVIHSRAHTGEKPYQCKLCPKAFRKNGSLATHMITHTGARPFLCTVCGVAFRTQKTLQTHSYQHTNELPFACDICGRQFRSKILRQRHVSVHSDAKPYACQQCPKTFRLMQLLKQHMVTHAKIKPIECTFCGKRFTQRHALKSHQAKSCQGFRNNDNDNI